MNDFMRMRRTRGKQALRSLVRETRVSKDSLVWPIFIKEGTGIFEEIPSMPGQYHYSPDQLHRAVARARESGVGKLLLFGLPAEKDAEGTGAWAKDGIVQQGLRALKQLAPELLLITDICMCEYTSHGHCGILCDHEVDNDKTLEKLCRIALSHARAGADMVAPSDMMDGRIGAIRQFLDANGFGDIPIMSYAAKYASAFYGPFRDAAGSAPSFGDRKSYQMDMHNSREALRECAADVDEGADILMIKPAMSYLDIIAKARDAFALPIAAYAVSGEYAMIKAAAQAGLVDEYGMMCETAISIYRAGADILITYYACALAQAMDKGDIG